MTLFLGKMLPLSAIGYIGWAKKWAEVPIRLIMDSVMRVTFPAFSRIQDSKDLLGKALTKTFFGIALLMTPITVGLIAFIQPLIHIIPKYAKWEPALIPFYLFSLTSLISGFTTPMTNMLSAIGQIKITLRLMVIWTLLTWLGTVLFLYFIGYLGFPITLLLVSLSIIYVIHIVKKYSIFSFIDSVKTPFLGGIIQGLSSIILLKYVENTTPNVLMIAVFSAILYIGVVWKFERDRILSFLAFSKP
jgi:O-antigen/teichoic acid export membrane protein